MKKVVALEGAMTEQGMMQERCGHGRHYKEVCPECDAEKAEVEPQAPAADEQFQEWALSVLRSEDLMSWKVKDGEPYCWIGEKTITFTFSEHVGDCASWLHEIAHALYPYPEKADPSLPEPNYYHGGNWAATFGKLVQKYMVATSVVATRDARIVEREAEEKL